MQVASCFRQREGTCVDSSMYSMMLCMWGPSRSGCKCSSCTSPVHTGFLTSVLGSCASANSPARYLRQAADKGACGPQDIPLHIELGSKCAQDEAAHMASGTLPVCKWTWNKPGAEFADL